MITPGYSLCKLTQIVLRQFFAELGLCNQYDLQQLLPGGFQVGQQAQLLEHIVVEVLCLVD